MRTTMHAVGKLAMVLAVAVLLLGGVTTSALASPRSEGVSQANDFVFGCVSSGGDPVVIMDTTGENLTVLCRYSDGSVSVCQFLPVVKSCQWVHPLKATEPTPSRGTRTK